MAYDYAFFNSAFYPMWDGKMSIRGHIFETSLENIMKISHLRKLLERRRILETSLEK